jgi:CelD/BcsL family acetyltransferase involved in cellulose biosynthesis
MAGQFCLRLGSTLYVLKIGYLEEHAALAPGNMLLERVIQSATEEAAPIRSFNLISGARWHDDWKPVSESVWDLWLGRPSWFARGSFAAAGALRAAARLRRRLARSEGATPVRPSALVAAST